jgi:hypothetical protein
VQPPTQAEEGLVTHRKTALVAADATVVAEVGVAGVEVQTTGRTSASDGCDQAAVPMAILPISFVQAGLGGETSYEFLRARHANVVFGLTNLSI